MAFPTFKQEFHLPGIQLLPHRDPFLFVDELIAADETGAIGSYTFTLEKNEFFKGHFPFFPIVPGVVLIEAMCQVAGAAVVARKILPEGAAAFILGGVDKVRFRRPVRPGDTLVTVVENVRVMSRLGIFRMKGYVGDELAVESEAKCVLSTQEQLTT